MPSPPPVIKPPLKWVGGKTQLLSALRSRVPERFNRYIEPFVGGGALFFALQPHDAVIADNNPELINFYRQLACQPEAIMDEVSRWDNSAATFYRLRAQDWTALAPHVAAARMLYLNRTCFNGLYRVNKAGIFNVPYGRYKNPRFFDRDNLMRAAQLLAQATIVLGDYKVVLHEYAGAGDFVFLDPPYVPVSAYADFKRYTKEQFRVKDHVALASEVGRLRELGCHALLTNSNHQSVREQYAEYDVMAVKSKRYVSCKSDSRTGEDLIITNAPNESYRVKYVSPLPRQVSLFPPTRYMGSKSRLLPDIMAIVCQMQFDHVIDLFAGSGIVSYLFKACGKRVVSNDYMHMSATVVKALIENNKVTLSASDVKRLLTGTSEDHFVEETFRGLYFSDDDNRLIDLLRSNIKRLRDDYKRALAMSALMRACMKRRARGIFTYVGQRYDDGRRDLSLPLSQHFCEAVETLNKAVFDNGISNQALLGDAMHVEPHGAGLVYLDPPYYSLYSDNEYVRRYHFVEGLARDWQGVRIQANTKTKKFLSYPSPFASRRGAAQAFDSLFQRHRKAMLLVSYSSNSLPTQEEMIGLMRKYKKSVRVVPVAYKYSFGNQGWTAGRNRNAVQEYLFVGE